MKNLLASVLKVNMWRYALVIYRSLAAHSSSLFASMSLANYLNTTAQLLPLTFLFFSFAFFLSFSLFFFTFLIRQSNRNQSRERDHRGTKSKERSGERELPSTVSQTAARDRAIQQKRKEIDEVDGVSLHSHTHAHSHAHTRVGRRGSYKQKSKDKKSWD